jgi:hypothetical protein
MEDTYMKRRSMRILTIVVGYGVQPNNHDKDKKHGTRNHVKNETSMHEKER